MITVVLHPSLDISSKILTTTPTHTAPLILSGKAVDIVHVKLKWNSSSNRRTILTSSPQVRRIISMKWSLLHWENLQPLKHKNQGLYKAKASEWEGNFPGPEPPSKGFSYAASVQIMNYPWLQNRSFAVAAPHVILVCKIMRMVPRNMHQ